MPKIKEVLRIEIDEEIVGYCYRVGTIGHFLKGVSFARFESLIVTKVPASEIKPEVATCH